MRKKIGVFLILTATVALSLTGCKKKGEAEAVAPEEAVVEETEVAEEAPLDDVAPEETENVEEVSDDFWSDASELVKDNWEGGYISKVFISVEDGIQVDATYTDSEEGDVNYTVPVSTLIESLSEQYPDEAANIKELAGTVASTTGVDVDELALSAEQLTEFLGYEILFQDETGICFTKAFQTKRLIITDVTDSISAEEYGAKDVVNSGEGMIVMQFETIEATKKAYEQLVEKYGEDHVRPDRVVAVDSSDYGSLEEIDAMSAFPWYGEWMDSDYMSWGAVRIGVEDFVEQMSDDAKKEEIVVAVLDTGLDPTEPIFEGRVAQGYSYTYDSYDTTDYQGHGTHVAGTILDLTRGTNVKVMPIQVLFEDGSGSELSVLYGLYDAINMGVDIINMSLGIPVMYQEEGDLEDELIQEATDAGILIVCAAGNDAIFTENVCPAHHESVLCVSMSDITDSRSYYSNYGFSVGIAAPGQDITSAYLNGEREVLEGTSMASPHIAACAALIKASGLATEPADIIELLEKYADDAGYPGKDVFYGAGIANMSKLAAAEFGGVTTPDPLVPEVEDDNTTTTPEEPEVEEPEAEEPDDDVVDTSAGYVEVSIQKMTTIDQKAYYVIALYTEDDINDYTVKIDGADYTKKVKPTSNSTKYTIKLDSISAGDHELTIDMNDTPIFVGTFTTEK